MPDVFSFADALGLRTVSLAANAQGVLNSAAVVEDAPLPFPVFDYEAHVKATLAFDLDPQKKSGGEGVCRFFLKGFCAKGQMCPYKHVSQATLNANASKAGVVCKHYLRGLCKKGDLCEFLHEYNLKKMPECWFFSKFQSCTNPECQYLHIDPNSKVKECPWYARGFCKHGPKCRNKHVRQAVCQNYVTGFCPKGPECPFGHPKFELPNLNEDASGNPQPGGWNPGFKKDVMCYKCKQQGHIAVHCPNEQVSMPNATGGGFKKDFSQVKCYNCQGFGHFANFCPKGGQNQGNRFRPPNNGGF